MTDTIVLSAEGLTKSYGAVKALNGVDLEARRGEVFGLLGPNGAGKTTTVKILTTLEHGFTGRATLFGLDVAKNPDACRARIGYVPQELTADRYLTARESLDFFCRLYHVPRAARQARIDHLIELLGLGEAADRLLRTFSGGMKKKLDLACGLVHQPELLFLDEPSLGLDVDVRRALWDHIQRLAEAGTTVVLCTNYMDEAERLCDRLAILDRGRVSAVGTPNELREGLGGDVVSLELPRDSDGDRAETALKALGFVRGTWREEAAPRDATMRLHATVDNNEQALPALLATLAKSSIPVVGVSYHRPGLEEVFLRYTGHRFANAHGQSGPPPEARMNHFLVETGAQLQRWLIRLKREPFNLTFALVQPLMIFVFLGSSLRGAVRPDVAGDDYLTFLLGGVLALTVFGNSMAGGISLLFDKESGFLTRCLVAPISRASILVARFLAVNLVSAIQALIMLALATLFGVRVASGLSGVALLLLVGWMLGLGVTIISLVLAFTLRGHGDFFAIVGTLTLPISFLSTAFVPLDSMPGWMRVLARLNPLSYAVDGMRSLIVNHAIDLRTLATAAMALLVFDVLMVGLGVRVLRRHVS